MFCLRKSVLIIFIYLNQGCQLEPLFGENKPLPMIITLMTNCFSSWLCRIVVGQNSKQKRISSQSIDSWLCRIVLVVGDTVLNRKGSGHTGECGVVGGPSGPHKYFQHDMEQPPFCPWDVEHGGLRVEWGWTCFCFHMLSTDISWVIKDLNKSPPSDIGDRATKRWKRWDH